MSKRLYQIDSYRTTFESAVKCRFPEGDGVGIVLEETCFYPTSGGQYADHGELGGVPVDDVRLEGDDIVHVLARDPGGSRLEGRVDWARRFDHMQQHTGQHILSQGFFRLLDLQTVSAHLGAAMSTIELPAESIAPEDLDRVEVEANRIVFACLPIRIVQMSRDEAKAGGVRKVPDRSGPLRIVEIGDFDRTGCGGTHCRSTGEVGLIKIGTTERIRRQTRIEFLCGWRALTDYGNYRRWLDGAALELGRRPENLPDDVRKLVSDAGARKREIASLEREILEYRASGMLAEAETVGGVRLVSARMDDLSPETLTSLGGRLASEPGVAVLLASARERGHLVAARSENVEFDMGRLLRETLAQSGGKGGGKPSFARGAVDADRLETALGDLDRAIRDLLSDGA